MPVTVAYIESAILRRMRVGRWSALAGLDGSTSTGSNLDLAPAVVHGLASMGLSVADPTAPVDADVSALTPRSLDGVISIALLRTLETIRLGLPFGKDRPELHLMDLSWDKLVGLLDKAIDDLRESCKSQFGYGRAPLESGAYDHGIAATQAYYDSIMD